MSNTDQITLIRKPAVLAQCGFSSSQLYSLMRRGLFPKPIRLGGGRATGWLANEVHDWIKARIKESRGEAA